MALAIVNVFLVGLIGYAYWRLPDVFAPSLAFGVCIPFERRGDSAIRRARRLYRALLTPLTLVAGAAAVLVRSAAAPYAALPPVALMIAAYAAYYAGHRMVHAAKEQGRWYQGQREAAVADLGSRRSPRAYPTALLVLALLVLAATVTIGLLRYPHLPAVLATYLGRNGAANGWSRKTPASAFLLVFMQVGLTALLALLSVALPRLRREIDPASPARPHKATSFNERSSARSWSSPWP